MDQKPVITKDTSPDVIEKDIAMTRREMSDTIDEIEERFSAGHWKAIARDMYRSAVDSTVSAGKQLAGSIRTSASRFGHAAGGTSEKARDAVARFISNDPAAALIIAFEMGAWTAIGLDALKTRKWKRSGTEYARAKIMSIEEVEQKVERAATAPESG